MPLRLPQVGDHTESDGAASRAETAQCTAHYDCPKARCEGHGDLPDVDETQRELKDGPATKFLGLGRSQLAAEGVGDQEDRRTDSGGLLTHIEGRTDADDGVGVERGVEVHRDLHDEDDGEHVPLLPLRPAVAQLVVAVLFRDFFIIK